MPKADADLIRMLAYERVSDTEIARRLGVSRRTVARHKPAELKKRPYGQPYPPEVKEAARALLEDRAGYAEAARTLGVDKRTIAHWFPGMGVSREESLERAVLARHCPLDKIGGLK